VGNCCNLAISLGDWTIRGTACSSNGDIGQSSVTVEGQNSTGQVLAQYAIHGVNQRGAGAHAPFSSFMTGMPSFLALSARVS
jgi:hypothetical protein